MIHAEGRCLWGTLAAHSAAFPRHALRPRRRRVQRQARCLLKRGGLALGLGGLPLPFEDAASLQLRVLPLAPRRALSVRDELAELNRRRVGGLGEVRRLLAGLDGVAGALSQQLDHACLRQVLGVAILVLYPIARVPVEVGDAARERAKALELLADLAADQEGDANARVTLLQDLLFLFRGHPSSAKTIDALLYRATAIFL